MWLYVCQKNIISIFTALVCFSSFCFGQLKNFGTVAKNKPEPNYLHSFYGYADIVREDGIGFQYQLLARYNLDFSAYLVNPNIYFKDKIRQWDYYDLRGYGLSFKPKYQFDLLSKWYVGLNLSFEWLQHDVVPVEYYFGRDYSYIYHYQESAKGTAYTIGITFGNKIRYQQIFIEPFFGIGITEAKLNKTIYGVDHKEPYQKDFPYTEIIKQSFFQSNLGVKIGFSFKKSKKHAAIDKKFDAVYNPKATHLIDYFKTIDPKIIEASKNLRIAYSRTKRLNHSILFRFKNNYTDTTNFYRKVDTLFQKIDFLITKGNQ